MYSLCSKNIEPEFFVTREAYTTPEVTKLLYSSLYYCITGTTNQTFEKTVENIDKGTSIHGCKYKHSNIKSKPVTPFLHSGINEIL